MGAAAEPSPDDRQIYEKTCRHYQNRTAFEARGGQLSFPAVLADSCRAALEALERAPGDYAEARAYLVRLTELKGAVVELQLRGYRAARPTSQRLERYSRSIASISEAGEYLIARRIGVIEALNDWTASGAKAPGTTTTAFKY